MSVKELGLKESFIITIPKTGLKINKSINYFEIPTIRRRNKKMIFKYHFLILTSIIILLFVFLYKYIDNLDIRQDNCNIHSINEDFSNSKDIKKLLIEHYG